MSRPDAPFHIGTTRPGPVGWTRIGLTALMAVLVLLLGLGTGLPVILVIAATAVIAGMAVWSWMRLWTRFIVDGDGVTISYGGFWPRPVWDIRTMRTVQLREIPGSELGVTVGQLGRGSGRVMVGSDADRRPVAGRPIHTPQEAQSRYLLLVTSAGTMVEIIGRDGPHALISARDPEQTALAIDQAIRARR